MSSERVTGEPGVLSRTFVGFIAARGRVAASVLGKVGTAPLALPVMALRVGMWQTNEKRAPGEAAAYVQC